jgi:hypothetical protein
MPLQNMVAIQTVTVGSGGASSIDFTNIPQTYTDLLLLTSLRNTSSSWEGWYLYFNNSNSNLSVRYLLGQGSAASSGSISSGYGGTVPGANVTASTFENSCVYVPNYAGSNNKSYSSDNVAENNSTVGYQNLIAGLWSQTSAITRFTIYPVGGTFVQYSTATLYGVTSAAVGAKATGGIISQDENYFYHTFLASGTFTPTSNITADCLVVAGGAGGGAGSSGTSRAGGGGGAGGMKTTTAQSLTASTAYTITIGGGGNAGSNGNSSSIAGSGLTTISTSGGGAGAAGSSASGTAGSNGGSGGGGIAQSGAGGTATSGEGNNGGVGRPNASTGGAGGGGGKGAVGGNTPTSSAGGDGGAGSESTYGITSVYYAGGGGGGAEALQDTAGVGGIGGGGKGAGSTTASVAGTANTGGGGGGGAGNSTSASAGGSGIVIVRYSK